MEFALPCEKPIDSIQIDPEHWVLKKVAYLNNISEKKNNLPFEIYPNPVTNTLRILVKDYPSFDIKILDPNGKIYFESTAGQNISNIDVGELLPGIYFVLIKTGKSAFSRKFIKIN